MAKLWTSLSLLLVFVMLLFLAPTLLLMPAQIVSADGEGVVQEVNATFSFTENASVSGNWSNFTAGGADIDALGLCLAQYTRDNVVRNTTLAGCEFREYTEGTGTVTGDLSGSLWISWLTYNFSQKYTSTPLVLYHDYGSSAHFGWMAGRGHYYDTGNASNNFTFGFVLDFDSDASMTNADGKGFLLSMNETGSFAGHKIIGDFDVLKNGGNYTWDLHLRNYDPSEVADLGLLNVSGLVLQETTDPIGYGLNLLSFTSDGPKPTPSANHTTDFEEITWGREPIKNITAGHLGVGGKMDLSRNNVLYLFIDAGSHPGETWVGIQGTPVVNLHIDDAYNASDDGFPYGQLYELLLLDLPNQYVQMVTYPYNFFHQSGYTFTPFGMFKSSTDCYAGTESYADAQILIEATSGTAHQYSTDHSYGLYPHPKVASVSPNSGSPGATMNVTISGKYFLRAAGAKSGWIPNSGNVSFGDNITVNYYTINNATNPIDNSITANITIAGGASVGARNVTVTSCFNYTFGNGTAPYKSGTKVDGFSVVTAGASLDGHVNLQGFPATNITVRFFAPGTQNEAAKKYGSTDANGNFTISGLTPDTYDVAVKGQTSLDNLVTGINVTVPGRTNFGVLLEGDANNDDYIDGSDYGPLSSAWLSYPGQPNWDPNVDFSRDNYIDGSDYGPLSSNWLLWGGTFGYPGNWN